MLQRPDLDVHGYIDIVLDGESPSAAQNRMRIDDRAVANRDSPWSQKRYVHADGGRRRRVPEHAPKPDTPKATAPKMSDRQVPSVSKEELLERTPIGGTRFRAFTAQVDPARGAAQILDVSFGSMVGIAYAGHT